MCLIFEGSLRKWVVPDTSIAGRIAYLSKYIALAAFLVLGAGRSNTLTRIARPYLGIGMVLLGLGAVISAAFGAVEPVGAVLTILNFFLLPLSGYAAGLKLPADSLRRFALWTAILSLLMAPLSVRQFYSPKDSFINRYSKEDEKQTISTSGVGKGENARVRATGTFSYIGGLCDFAPVAIWAAIVTFTFARTRCVRWLGYAALAAAICCTFTTVSRATAVNSAALLAVWAFAGGQFVRKAGAAFTIGVVGLAVLLFSGKWRSVEEISTTVFRRHAAVSDKVTGVGDTFSHRFWYSYILPFEAILVAPLGDGLGSQQAKGMQSARWHREGILFESAWGRTVMELGVLGLLGFLSTLAIVFAPLKAEYRKSKRGAQRTVVAVTAAVLLLKAVAGFQFNHVGACFFWAIGACVLALGNASAPASELGTSRPLQ